MAGDPAGVITRVTSPITEAATIGFMVLQEHHAPTIRQTAAVPSVRATVAPGTIPAWPAVVRVTMDVPPGATFPAITPPVRVQTVALRQRQYARAIPAIMEQ